MQQHGFQELYFGLRSVFKRHRQGGRHTEVSFGTKYTFPLPVTVTNIHRTFAAFNGTPTGGKGATVVINSYINSSVSFTAYNCNGSSDSGTQNVILVSLGY